jgi:phosphoribosylformimino-5-aminoimidazole carboxamide ribonucleotide (ProFAR) isomerase
VADKAVDWQVGQRIRRDVLHEQRAEYGEQIVATLSRQLTEEFGRGWNKAALIRMMQFAERFSDPKIVADAVATINLEPRGRTATVERFAPAGLLR